MTKSSTPPPKKTLTKRETITCTWLNTGSKILVFDRDTKNKLKIRTDDKKRYTPHHKTLTKRGTLLFVDREVFDVHVVVGINPTAQQDVCASTVHCSSHIHHHCIRTEQPNTQRPVAQALSSPKSQTYVRVTFLICAPRACVSSKKSLIIFRSY